MHLANSHSLWPSAHAMRVSLSLALLTGSPHFRVDLARTAFSLATVSDA